jgi:hypothetical protein
MMEKLRDIKPLVTIPDYSFYLYLVTIISVTLGVAAIIYMLISFFSRTKEDRRKVIIKKLESIDLNDSKRVAYTFTKYGKELIKDESSYKIYSELIRRLAKYKYKKEVEGLDEESLEYIKLFLKVAKDE